MRNFFDDSTCDKCEFHGVFLDEINGKEYHDGCTCNHEQAEKEGYHEKCCNSDEVCPFQKMKIDELN